MINPFIHLWYMTKQKGSSAVPTVANYVYARQIIFVATCYCIQVERCMGGHYVVSVATVGGVRLTYVIS